MKIGNVQKTNFIEKGISTITLESKFIKGIKDYFSEVKFDLVLYTTPPITLQKAVSFVKNRDNANVFALKDIFPQNALDLGLLKKNGLKGFLYKYFKVKEKKLYRISDYIGCMSKANVDYLLKHNPDIPSGIVEVCPNSIKPIYNKLNDSEKMKIKAKYRIPFNKTVFIYGGNLGKPQDIDFVIDCLRANRANDDVYFVITGSGTEYYKIKTFLEREKLNNVQLFSHLPREDYEVLVSACDVGLIFLNKRFTIPNFPSRLLSYMQASLPVLAATDINTDIGTVIKNGEFGFWCKSDDVKQFSNYINDLCDSKIRRQMGENARKYLEENYTSRHSYEIIMKHFE